MPRLAALALFVSLVTSCLEAQDLENLQIHGFVTQGFLFSTHNNYLTMKSSSGSLQWTEGAVSLNDSLSEKLRLGIQLHMYQVGQIGGPNLLVNWVSGDYKINDCPSECVPARSKCRLDCSMILRTWTLSSSGRCCRKETIPTTTAIPIWRF